MEENGSLSKSNPSKDYKNIINYMKSSKNDYCWENNHGEESFGDGRGDLVGDQFSWPPRSYTCTFCKREFRSAQALGGHMNVHRKEKAKLRQITPPRYLPPSSQYFSSNSKLLHPNPNPNPNISTCFASNASSFQTMFPPFTYSFMSPSPLILPSSSSVKPFSCFLPFSNTPCPLHRLCSSSDGASFTTMRSKKSDLISGGVDDVSHEQKNMIHNNSETSLFVESKLDDKDLELRLGCS